MSTGGAIPIGFITGVALGVVVSLATDLPLAPEVGALLGVLGGWLSGARASR